MRRLLALPVACLLALGVAACSDDDEPEADSTTTTEAGDGSGTSDSSDDGTSNGSNTSEDGNGSSSSGSGSEPVDPGDLPGERVDIYPYADAELGVIRVAADDTLNVRSGPGTSYDVVTELDPLAQGFTATGHNRSIDDEAFWVEIQADGQTGWVNGSFVSHIAVATDVTSQLQGEIVGDTAAELANEVVERLYGPAEAEGPRRRVITVDGPADADGGLTEIVVDVTGFGDDALTGYRLNVNGEPGEGGGEALFLTSVSQSPLCTRGVSEEGLCL